MGDLDLSYGNSPTEEIFHWDLLTKWFGITFWHKN